MRLLAIDPGPFESAFVIVGRDLKPDVHGKLANRELLNRLRGFGAFNVDRAVIEWISSYGMPVGAEVFDTCLWVGRFTEALYLGSGYEAERIKRGEVKVHLCGSAKAKDSNIRQALVDRFTPGQPNNGKGTKAEPGWFYGFRADIWQAHALAVYAVDTAQPKE